MKLGVSMVLVVAQLALSALSCCAVLCVHSDGQAYIEWSAQSCCDGEHHSKTKSPHARNDGTSKITNAACTDHPLTAAASHPVRGMQDALLHFAMIQDPPTTAMFARHLLLYKVEVLHCQLSPGTRTIEQLRTIVILC